VSGSKEYHAAAIDLTVEALLRGDTVRIRAQGASMMPAIWPGDVLKIRSVAEASPEIGEVALIRENDALRAHRVIAHRTRDGRQLIVTRGDALDADDAAVELSAVVGIVVARNGRPLDSPKGKGQLAFERVFHRSRVLQMLTLKFVALRNRYALPLSSNQFA